MSAEDEDLDLTVGAPEAPEVDVAPVTDDPDDPTAGLEHDALAPAPVAVDESMVRRLLKMAGDAAHGMSGDIGETEPEFLRFTDAELDNLTPPLAAYINQRPRLQAAVQRGDGVAVVLTLAGWSGRNLAAYRRYHEETDDGDERRETASPVRSADPGASGLGGKLGALAAARAGHDGRAAGQGPPRDVPGAAG